MSLATSKTTESTKKESNIYSAKISRGYLIAEAAKSVLVKIDTTEIWIPKKFISKSEYTLLANIGIIPEYDYNTSIKDEKVNGNTIIKYFEELKAKSK